MNSQKEVGVVVLSQESDGMDVTGFDNTSYGIVEISMSYSTVTDSALALLSSQVGSIDITTAMNTFQRLMLMQVLKQVLANTSGSISSDTTTSLGFTSVTVNNVEEI